MELSRCCVDEEYNLREIDTDAFVRRVLDDDNRALGEAPPDGNEDDEMISVLLHETIPPSFVHLEHPDDENVVTKVMELDVETNKYDLLVSLGRVAQQGQFTDEDIHKIEGALDKLHTLEDVEGIEEYIQNNLI